MSLVIVTDKCYLICESVNFINLQESPASTSYSYSRKTKKNTKTSSNLYEITIDFTPKPTTSRPGGPDVSTDVLKFKVRGKKEAENAFKLIVNQIREQIPDKFYINKLMEDFLTI